MQTHISLKIDNILKVKTEFIAFWKMYAHLEFEAGFPTFFRHLFCKQQSVNLQETNCWSFESKTMSHSCLL